MTETKSKGKACKLIGLLVFAAAVGSVFFIDWKPVEEEEEVIVRPLKTMVVEDSFAAKGRKYPGRVSAGRQINLAFEVSGSILEKAVDKGDEVKEGDLLMRLDERDFRNDYDSSVAERDRAKSQLERMEKAALDNAVSKQEVDNARASLNQAESAVNIKKKALEDTKLLAKFDGTIGDTFGEQFQTVRAKEPVLSLYDSSMIEIDVSVPESDAATAKPENRGKARLLATFDFFPGEEFPVEISEVTTEANAATQTYTVTVIMERPADKNLLPGMTATVTAFLPAEVLGDDAAGFGVPLDAVPVDGLGQYFVWKLEEAEGGNFTVHRADVEVGEVAGNEIVVRTGLAKGDRIALAGVHVLTEGREVRLLESKSEAPDAG